MLGMLFLIFILLSIGVSFFWGKYSFVGFNYSHRLSRECVFWGEKLEFYQEITNNKILPLPWLTVKTEVPADVHFLKGKVSYHYKQKTKVLTGLFSAIWYERILKRYPISCNTRGCFLFGPTQILSGDIFGFAQNSMEIKHQVKLIVYPRILDIRMEKGLNYNPAEDL